MRSGTRATSDLMGIVTSYITCPSTLYGAGTRGILTRGEAARDFNNPSQSAEMTLNKFKKKKKGDKRMDNFSRLFRQILRKIGGGGERVGFITRRRKYSFVHRTIREMMLSDAKVKSPL